MSVTVFKYIKRYFPRLEYILMRLWYWYVSRQDKQGKVTFMNYGFAYNSNSTIKLDKQDQSNRYPIQLYDHVVSNVTLKNKKLLEVGCGRGGGIDYLARYKHPDQIVGLDLCKKAIRSCNKIYGDYQNIRFTSGDALTLKQSFDPQTFDIVLNVESSHRYMDFSRFLEQTYHILTDGGYLLLTDFRNNAQQLTRTKNQLDDSPFTIQKEENITENVIRALELDTRRRITLIKKLTPPFLHSVAEEFAGTEGTKLYRSFVNGNRQYFNWVLQK